MHEFRSEIALDGVAAKRQRQSGLFAPPFAEIDHAVESRFGIGELAFVDDEPGLVASFEDLRNDLIERNNFRLYFRCEELEDQVGGRERAGNRDFPRLDLLRRQFLVRDDHWAVAFADA